MASFFVCGVYYYYYLQVLLFEITARHLAYLLRSFGHVGRRPQLHITLFSLLSDMKHFSLPPPEMSAIHQMISPLSVQSFNHLEQKRTKRCNGLLSSIIHLAFKNASLEPSQEHIFHIPEQERGR